MKRSKKGFTMVELLVVVLIIAILSTIAVPMYQSALERSRVVEAIALFTRLVEAQKAYYFTNGTFASTFADLDIDIPFTGKVKVANGNLSDYISNDYWSIGINRTGTYGPYMSMLRTKGDYKGAGLVFPLKEAKTAQNYRKIYCLEQYNAAAGYCTKVMHGTQLSAAAHSAMGVSSAQPFYEF